MAGKKKSRDVLLAENRLLRQQNFWTAAASVGNALIKWGGLVLISYFIYGSVSALAGKNTNADIGVNFLANIRVSEAVAWIFGTCGIGYGWRQRALRKSTIERLQGRVKTLESEFDKRRSSSNLTERGDTNPKDSL